jgi:Fur family ferric uptake transcriptional regulator
VSKGLVTKSNITGDNKALYEINNLDHTHHLICSGCKKMFSVDGCPLEEYEKQLMVKMDFDITGHKLEIFGVCKDCKAKKNNTIVHKM